MRELAPGVYAVLGDTGRGVEGRPNAGFVVTSEGVVVIDALASPRQGEQLLATIRGITDRPVKWLVLTHHHPDHHFGAVVFRNAGARVIAHPDRSARRGGGEDALIADWVRVVGLDAMRGFEFADVPDRPVTRADTLRLGGRTIVVTHPGSGHSAGDLLVWLPKERVLFAGDVLVEDGVSMVVDGNSDALMRVLDTVDAMRPVGRGAGARRDSPATGGAGAEDPRISYGSPGRDARGGGKAIPMRRALEALPADSTRVVELPPPPQRGPGLRGAGAQVHGSRRAVTHRLRTGVLAVLWLVAACGASRSTSSDMARRPHRCRARSRPMSSRPG